MSGQGSSIVRDRVIAAANSLPDLIAKAEQVDPGLALQLTPKPLVQSKVLWGTVASMIVTWLVTKYGLAWDANTCAIVTGLITTAATGLTRYVSTQSISGIFRKQGA